MPPVGCWISLQRHRILKGGLRRARETPVLRLFPPAVGQSPAVSFIAHLSDFTLTHITSFCIHSLAGLTLMLSHSLRYLKATTRFATAEPLVHVSLNLTYHRYSRFGLQVCLSKHRFDEGFGMRDSIAWPSKHSDLPC
jgi:hypothetical protein